MTILATELAEVAPIRADWLATDGTRILAVGRGVTEPGLMPPGSFSILDTSTEEARAFTGLSTSTDYTYDGYGQCSAWYQGGYFWSTANRSNAYRIHPTTGAVSTHGLARRHLYGMIFGAGDWIICPPTASGWGVGGWRLQLSTFAGHNMNYPHTVMGGVPDPDGTHVWLRHIGSLSKYNPATDTIGASVPWGGANWVGRGAALGGLFYFAVGSSVVEIDPSIPSLTSYSHALVPGSPTSSSDIVAHSDGWLYMYGATNDDLIGFHPPTGSFGKQALSPTRGHRSQIISAGGKLWIPSGEPLS